MGALSPVHWLVVIGVLAVLFGAAKLPGIARTAGRSVRVLKAEIDALREAGVKAKGQAAAPLPPDPPMPPAAGDQAAPPASRGPA